MQSSKEVAHKNFLGKQENYPYKIVHRFYQFEGIMCFMDWTCGLSWKLLLNNNPDIIFLPPLLSYNCWYSSSLQDIKVVAH